MESTCQFSVYCVFVLIIAVHIHEEALALGVPYADISAAKDEYDLPELPFEYDGLEPFVDEATLRVHHTGHHAAYTRNMNAALRTWRAEQPHDELAGKSILDILKNIELVPEKYRKALRNNGGGYVNHAIYWACMAANPSATPREPKGWIQNQILKTFGNYSNFKDEFTKQASTLFGSGYTWLSKKQNPEGELVISTTANQDSVISAGLQPLLVLDVWEHSYYLKHQNRRAQYIEDWWKVVDWESVDRMATWWTSSPKDEL